MAYRTIATVLLIPVFSAALVCQEPASSPPSPASPQSQSQAQTNAQPSAAQSQMGNIMGTVTALDGNIVPGASVVVAGAMPTDRRTAVANDRGFFEIDGLTPGTSYHVTVSAKGFADWNSPAITVNPGQYLIVKDCKLKIEEVKTTVVVGAASSVELATEQLKTEETQRLFGIVPNFYVAYDKNAAPLTAKMKFQLALKTSVDPVTFLGVAIVAGFNQATDRPDYVQGAKGFGQRLGASYADEVSDIMIGGAVLPALLHQDPRYYYQGTGTKKSRAFHAIASTFICKGDNGRWQPNYSTIGGDLASSSLSMAYYPDSDRGAWAVFEGFLIDTAERMGANLAQEFLFRKLTKVKKQ